MATTSLVYYQQSFIKPKPINKSHAVNQACLLACCGLSPSNFAADATGISIHKKEIKKDKRDQTPHNRVPPHNAERCGGMTFPFFGDTNSRLQRHAKMK